MTRHISIDDTPITHTYHQPNSLDTSSDSSHSPEEVSQALGSFVPIIMLLGEFGCKLLAGSVAMDQYANGSEAVMFMCSVSPVSA